MEELLAFLFQIVIELTVQLFIYFPFDFGLSAAWSHAQRQTADDKANGWAYFFLFMILGGMGGGLSLWVEPRLLLPYAWMRITNLIATPILAGGISWLIAEWRQKKHSEILSGQHFWSAYWFALAFGIVRFAFGTR